MAAPDIKEILADQEKVDKLVQAAFDQVDKDKSGSIDRSELTAVCSVVFCFCQLNAYMYFVLYCWRKSGGGDLKCSRVSSKIRGCSIWTRSTRTSVLRSLHTLCK